MLKSALLLYILGVHKSFFCIHQYLIFCSDSVDGRDAVRAFWRGVDDDTKIRLADSTGDEIDKTQGIGPGDKVSTGWIILFKVFFDRRVKVYRFYHLLYMLNLMIKIQAGDSQSQRQQ